MRQIKKINEVEVKENGNFLNSERKSHSTTTAHKCLKTGLIPHVKVGSIYLFNEVEVLEALKNRKNKRPDNDVN
jgi:hypothetical protein